MGQPKVSNWFAWNGMAYDLMPEFHATKCIFECQLQPTDDPDDGNPFDHIGKDPKAQLQYSDRAGGCIWPISSCRLIYYGICEFSGP